MHQIKLTKIIFLNGRGRGRVGARDVATGKPHTLGPSSGTTSALVSSQRGGLQAGTCLSSSQRARRVLGAPGCSAARTEGRETALGARSLLVKAINTDRPGTISKAEPIHKAITALDSHPPLALVWPGCESSCRTGPVHPAAQNQPKGSGRSCPGISVLYSQNRLRGDSGTGDSQPQLQAQEGTGLPGDLH